MIHAILPSTESKKASPFRAQRRNLKDRIKTGEEIKFIFRNSQSVGDILTLTASIRELKQKYPRLKICMKTACGEIWENNPYICEFPEEEAEFDMVLEYPLIHESNQCGKHMIHGFLEDLSGKLGIDLKLNNFKCDVHLSEQEKGWKNQVYETFGYKGDFWLINCGTKSDFPLKQWRLDRWMEVVERLKRKIKFVQVGEKNHRHVVLDGVFNLIGQTDLRQMIRLGYHATGALSHVSMLNHLMSCWDKPCITVAGGRESSGWEAYNQTIYVHTVGVLNCCKFGGCWKSKESECENMEKEYPKCMNLIQTDDVVNAVLKYLR